MSEIPQAIDDMAKERELVREQAPDHYYDDEDDDTDDDSSPVKESIDQAHREAQQNGDIFEGGEAGHL